MCTYSFTKRQGGKYKTSYVGVTLSNTVIRAWENENARNGVYQIMMQGLLPKYRQCSMLSIYEELGNEADDSDEEEEVATAMTPKTLAAPAYTSFQTWQKQRTPQTCCTVWLWRGFLKVKFFL